jgi:RHS repeat-associated protein
MYANRLFDVDAGSLLKLYLRSPFGWRIAKIVNGIITEKYLWQGLTKLLAVYDGNDNLLMRFGYADDRVPLWVTCEAVKYYLAYDQVGSLRVVFDSVGNIIKRIDYDTFGFILSDSNPALRVPFGFAGGLHDRNTGLVRFGYRDYDPETGRWTAKDPIFFEGGDTDLYGYVQNDPVNMIDPEGLWVAQAIGGILGGSTNAYNNYNAYKAGQISGSEYAKSIAFGAGMGVLSSFAPGIWGATLFGGTTSAINNINNQMITSPCRINWNQVGNTFSGGAFSGWMGGLGSKLGSNVITIPNQIGKIVRSKGAQTISYGSVGGITGEVGGTLLTK